MITLSHYKNVKLSIIKINQAMPVWTKKQERIRIILGKSSLKHLNTILEGLLLFSH